MRLNFIIFIFAFIPILLSAQINNDNDKVVFEDEFRKSFHTKPKLDVKFDNRFSFIQDNALRTVGLKIGLSFRRKFKVGLGINQMLVPTERQVELKDKTWVNADLEYFYFSPYIEYVYFNSKKWEFSLSAQLGIGGASYQYNNAEGNKVKIIESTVLSYEPAMLIDYKIIRWFGIGTEIGRAHV